MENFELCEKLVNKTGVSYAQAKSALEKNSWDLLDALVFLEEEGVIPSAGGPYSASAAADEGSTQSENVRGRSHDNPGQRSYSRDTTYDNEQAFRSEQDCRKKRQERVNNAKAEAGSFLRKVGRFLCDNRVIAANNVGREVLNIPVWIAIVVFMCTFWITTILVLFSFVKGWQYRFAGPELGRDGVNKAAGAVGSAVYHAGQDIKTNFENKRNSNEGCRNPEESSDNYEG